MSEIFEIYVCRGMKVIRKMERNFNTDINNETYEVMKKFQYLSHD